MANYEKAYKMAEQKGEAQLALSRQKPNSIALKYELTMSSAISSDPGYTLRMEDREGYLYALASGERLTPRISAAYWNEIAGRCFENNVNRILIEKDFREAVGPEEMLRMADHLGNLLPGRRIAFLDRYHHDPINELGKKLARNRDVMMQIFDSVENAERWLRAN